MLRNMSVEQLKEWIKFDELEPFGEWRDDRRFASIPYFVACMLRSSTSQAPKLDDFLLGFGDEKSGVAPTRNQSPEEQRRAFEIWAKAWAGAKRTDKTH